jgi:hypothetical protein
MLGFEGLKQHPNCVYHDDWVVLLNTKWEHVQLEPVGAVIMDAPYSEKTSKGQHEHRSGFAYDSWNATDVHACVHALSPICRGWFVSITDDVLFNEWRNAYANVKRKTFQTVSAFMPGMTVRLSGDGPSSWSLPIAVGRPRGFKWRTLPGGYTGEPNRTKFKGAKPEWLMCALVRDYTKDGDVVLDPCAGSGTTGRACKDMGRRCILIEERESACKATIKRLRQEPLGFYQRSQNPEQLDIGSVI